MCDTACQHIITNKLNLFSRQRKRPWVSGRGGHLFVYTLVSVISSKLARVGVVGVFIYGGLILIA